MSAVMEIKYWSDLSEQQQKIITVVFCELLNAKKLSVMRRIWNIGNPKLILTYDVIDSEMVTNFKISDESRKPFMVILNQYLNEAL
jgi:hypothetical protein